MHLRDTCGWPMPQVSEKLINPKPSASVSGSTARLAPVFGCTVTKTARFSRSYFSSSIFPSLSLDHRLTWTQAIEGRVKVDPMRKLPKELQGMVLGYLPVTKLGAIMSVSRLWNEACREPRLWKDLRFIRHWSSGEPRPFPRGALSTIIKYAENSVTSLHITGLKDFSLSGPMLRQMLRALPQLQSLALGITNPRYPSPRLTFDYELLTWHDVWNILLDVAPSTLTALSLSTFALTDAAQQALQPVSGIPEFAQNLEQLTLVGVADRDIHPWTAFAWPKLTKLSLTGPEGWSRVRVNTGLGFKMVSCT